MDIPFVFILFIFVAVVIRLVAGGMDDDRVGQYITSQGGRLIEKRWAPFGTGWFGTRDSRIYEIVYADRMGNIHAATCKTSMLAGVYFTEDHIIEHRVPPPAEHPVATLAEENQRLREEIERLKREQQ